MPHRALIIVQIMARSNLDSTTSKLEDLLEYRLGLPAKSRQLSDAKCSGHLFEIETYIVNLEGAQQRQYHRELFRARGANDNVLARSIFRQWIFDFVHYSKFDRHSALLRAHSFFGSFWIAFSLYGTSTFVIPSSS